MEKLTVQLLLTGNELMSGDIIDSNSAMIAQHLRELGIDIVRKVTVKDDLALLAQEIIQLSRDSDILIINGGLGPTVDDMTALALADVIGQPLVEHPAALEHLENWCARRGFELNAPNRKQASLPKGADILDNAIGSAVGFAVNYHDCRIFCTPGVPSEAEQMLTQVIMPQLAAFLPEDQHTEIHRMQVFGIGESTLQRLIDEQLPDWPETIELGFRAARPLVEVKLATQDPLISALSRQWQNKLRQLLGSHIVGEGTASLPEVVIDLLRERKQQVTFAESCTGGLIAANLTRIAGASDVFEAGFVSYSNDIKHQLLAVSEQDLQEHGAVSEPVVRQMALGAMTRSGADFAVAVSGIAGPGGGSEHKPVGTVWIAWGDKDNLHSQSLHLPGSRAYFQHFVAAAGLDLLRRHLLDITDTPRYVTERQPKG